MSQRTVYKCDKCGFEREKKNEYKEEEKEMQFFSLAVFRCKGTYLHLDYNSTRISQEVHWCQKCCEENKIMAPLVEPRDLSSLLPTLEDSLREIIREEIQQATGA